MVDLIAGRLDAAFDNVATSLPHVRGARLRALAVSSAKRVAVAPETPTLAETGVEAYAYQAWQGLFAPSGTAPETLEDHTVLAFAAHIEREFGGFAPPPGYAAS